ncbi:PREDICTED: UPF0481 protein At3g47200-like [Nicotiana attenuata]|uniref:UPF0481 protein At3g47200-like n=1 Tax=Nicotiana attenuata TaxID=49451 RepID=UPI00090471D4|nr:PREDICTED: UPF0481 protein At3g47200-like [Nicotiana attenuata]
MSQGKMKEEDISYTNIKTKDHVLLDIVQEEEDLVESIGEKMKNISSFHRINRVPQEVKKGSENSYSPKLVSIGPFHHGVDTLKNMEEQKWCYLNTLVSRKPINTQPILENCVKALRNLEEKARKCYGEDTIDQIGSNEFVQMMLLDCGFIIEVFIKLALKGYRRRDDMFFSNYEMFFRLRCDLILLENQIPFFVLHQIFHLVPIPKECNYSLIQLSLLFFRKLIPGEGLITIEKFGPEVHHLLDLVRQCYLPTIPQIQPNGVQKHLHNVLHLHAVGIKFKKAVSESVMNVRFTKDKVLEIPTLKIHNYSEILFRNLMALEHFGSTSMRVRYPASDVRTTVSTTTLRAHSNIGSKHVMSYVYLMKSLVRSAKDASHLIQREILDSSLYNDEEIFQLFHKLHVEFDVKDFYYSGLCEKVNGYKKKTMWKVCCQKLSNVYKKTS